MWMCSFGWFKGKNILVKDLVWLEGENLFENILKRDLCDIKNAILKISVWLRSDSV